MYLMSHPHLCAGLGLLGICLLASIPAYADSWVVTQAVNVTNAVTMNQTNTTNSKQAMNAVNLGNSTLNNSSQTVTAGNGVTMNQTDANSSKQAMNMILSTGTVNNTSQTVNMSSKDLTLKQSGSTSNSHQAANMMQATTIEGNSSQSVTGLSDLTLEATSSGSVQAVNMASATDMGGLSQAVSASGNVKFKLAGCTNCYQAGNYMNTDNITASMSQTFTGGTIDYSESTGANTGSVQAGNILIRKIGGTVTGTVSQSFNGASINVYGNSTPHSVTQAGNYFAKR